MLSKKPKEIKKPFDYPQIVRHDEMVRMLNATRRDIISDELTQIKSAEERGFRIGIKQGLEQVATEKAIEFAVNLLKVGISEDIIADCIGFPIEKVMELKKTIIL